MGQLIVVLDDDDTVFDGVVKSLEEAGYLVLPLSTADGLVDELKATEAAALIVDLHTAAVTAGAAIFTLLEEDATLRSLPVLVYSADAHQLDDLSPSLLARGYSSMRKPPDIGGILRWLRERVG